ncbi:MurR/RpiR family transcriptional regulator [Lacticigenium naphthae]|uniref:MurR/RpiR family transcriptional regulator n=1 Tax=Lacticigenium naphthae TaxID=515351 RepID=UPI00040C0C77|nr:MurR/RpiR family transcriptional regulator [Lacticigenium naphthae]
MIFNNMKQLTSLTASEKTLVDYIFTHPKKVISSDSQTLAKEAFVSVSTIYRLLNKLDLNGLNDFKVHIASEIKKEEEQPSSLNLDYPIIPEDTPFQIMKNLQYVYTQTINETLLLNSPDRLREIQQLVVNAEQINVFASAGNIPFTQNFQFQMQEIGRDVKVPVDEYNQRLIAANSTPEDLAIIVSFGGRGIMVDRLFSILKENHVPILLISSADNELKKEADHCLWMSALENHYNKVSSFGTRMSLLYILDTVYTLCFHEKYEANQSFKLSRYKKISQPFKLE